MHPLRCLSALWWPAGSASGRADRWRHKCSSYTAQPMAYLLRFVRPASSDNWGVQSALRLGIGIGLWLGVHRAERRVQSQAAWPERQSSVPGRKRHHERDPQQPRQVRPAHLHSAVQQRRNSTRRWAPRLKRALCNSQCVWPLTQDSFLVSTSYLCWLAHSFRILKSGFLFLFNVSKFIAHFTVLDVTVNSSKLYTTQESSGAGRAPAFAKSF